MSGQPEFEAGTIVRDRDDEDPNDAVVVNTPPVTAAEWEVRPRETTLAADNPSYPEDAAVVIVVFRETLEVLRAGGCRRARWRADECAADQSRRRGAGPVLCVPCSTPRSDGRAIRIRGHRRG